MSCVARVHFRFACQTTISFYAGLTGVTEEEWDGLDYWENEEKWDKNLLRAGVREYSQGFWVTSEGLSCLQSLTN